MNFLPTTITKKQCLSLLPTSSSLHHLFQIHALLLTSGFHHDGFLTSELLRLCALSPFGSLAHARSLLSHTPHPTTSSWNHLIRAYSKTPSPRQALLLYAAMRSSGKLGNELTFPFLFTSCAALSALQEGRQIQVQVLKGGVEANVFVRNSMIHFYGSCREVGDARRVFDEMGLRTVVSWNAVVSACVENSALDEAVVVFAEMRRCGFEPDETTMVVVLSACAELGNLSLGRWVHSQIMEKGLLVNVKLGTALVDMYAKCGDVGYAAMVFEGMVERNVWTWSAMILGYAQHGLAKQAMRLFDDMMNDPVRPNYVTFLGVLCACSHARMVDEGYRVFDEMRRIHGIKPMMTHYAAMVDILSRSGKLEEAYNFIMRMPIDPDPIVWRTLLAACSIHHFNNSSDITTKVRKKLFDLEPRRCGNLVIVANMYAEDGSWEEAAVTRRVMIDGGLKKKAGESWVEVGGLVHKFLCGDDTKEILQPLDGLNLHMKTDDCDLITFPCSL